MINPDEAWSLIRANALKAQKASLIWHSLKKKKGYKLAVVNSDSLEIVRLRGGNSEVLTKTTVIKAANDFNNAGCRVQRRHLISPTVAEETAFVLFHPALTWDASNEFIVQV